MEREGLDAAVRYGVGPWAALKSTPLCDVVATAVCAPGLIRGNRITSPAAFARYPLIHLRGQPDPWQLLAEYAAVGLPSERRVFDSYLAMVRAAEKGLGIAVGLFPTTTSAVTEGRLITPFPLRVRLRARFHFVCRKQDAERPAFVAVREWARARFAALVALPDARGITTLDEA